MRILKRLLPLLAAFLILSPALAVANPAAKDTGDKAFEEKVHAYLLAHPEVLLAMQKALEEKDAVSARATLQKQAARLFDDGRDPSVGPKDAKVSVVLFQDYQCGHCKAEAAPAVIKLLAAQPDVRFVFKELPIFGQRSVAAARAAIAAARQGKYFGVFKALMADTVLDDAAIKAALTDAGIDLKRAQADAESKETKALLDDNAKLAGEIGVDGTPTFVIGDQMVLGADIEEVERAIADRKKK
jgi:protein-disulfide isomerase